MRKPKLPLSFKIFPDNGVLYFTVTIHRSKRAMHKVAKRPPNNYEAICCGSERFFVPPKGPEVFSGEIGEVHFYSGSFRAGILAHEMTHATFRYFDWRKEWHPVKCATKGAGGRVSHYEEAFCYVLGNLYRQATINFNNDGKQYRARHLPPADYGFVPATLKRRKLG